MFNRWNDYVEELGNPEPRSADRRQQYQTRSAGVEKHKPPKREMDDHWELFQTVSIVREPIRAFAVEIFSNGYYVDSESEEAREDLEEWLSDCAIVNADVDKDFREIGKEVAIQQEVRGTALVEVVDDEDGGVYGFKSIPPHTVKQYTKPGQSILLAPDENVDGLTEGKEYLRTDDGEVAAYVQFDDSLTRFSDKERIPFTRDQVLKFVRDGDVGQVWGNSRLEAVQDRVESLLDKLDNNDQAIESLAYKFWLFKFGNEENPWPEEDIRDFMENHSPEEFEPGQKQGVQGNVGIETVSGEVAEIEEYLDFDVDWIISSMPYPKYGLGGFEENVNQFVSRSQETRVNNQIKEARKDLEEKFTPVLQQKAEELGYDPEDVKLIIDTPPEEQEDEWIEPGDVPDGETDQTRPPASTEDEDGPEPTRPEMREDGEDGESGYSIWDQDESVAELADPRFVNVEDEQAALQEMATDTLLNVRDEVISEFESEFGRQAPSLGGHGRPQAAWRYRKPAERAVRSVMGRSGIPRRSTPYFSESLQETYAALEREGLAEEGSFGFRDQQAVRGYADNFYASVRDAAEEMARDISHTVRAGLERGEEFQRIRLRAEDEFGEPNVGNTARLISQMETKNAIETTRLREYRESDDVVGVKPITSCSETTTPLCRRVAGCDSGEPLTAYFDEEASIGEQIQEEISEEYLFQGFDPLPDAPPYHWACTTELVAIPADEEELSEDSG